MWKVKVFVYNQPIVEKNFSNWGEVKPFIESHPRRACALIIHSNGGLVFHDSPDGEPAKQGV